MMMESENSTSNYSSCDNDVRHDTISVIITAIYPVIVCLDSFVLYLAFKYINFKQNLEQLFVVNMTAADLMFGIVNLTPINHHLNIPRWLCKPFYVLNWMLNIASVNFLLSLNVYKFFILFFPIYSFANMSKFKITIQTAVSWLLVMVAAVSFSFEPTFTLIPHMCHSCQVNFHPKMYAVMIMCFYIIPLTVSLVLSVLIFGLAQSRSIRRKNQQHNIREECKKMFGRIIFVFTSTVWASLTFLPYRISMFRRNLCLYAYGMKPSDLEVNIVTHKTAKFEETSYIRQPDHICYTYLDRMVQSSLLVLLVLGFAINPLITICTQQIYRERVVYLCRQIRNFFGKNAEDVEQNTYHRDGSTRHVGSSSNQSVNNVNSVL